MSVTGTKRPSRIFNLPTERILKQPEISKLYFSASNFILPIKETNGIVLQGFYDEIKTFVDIVENRGNNVIHNDLHGMLSLYNILEKLKNKTT